MIKVMFWNIDKKKNFEQTIVDVVNEENVDVLLLAEAGNVDDTFIEANTTIKLNKVNSPNKKADEIKKTPRFYSNNRGFKLEYYHTYPNTKRMVFTKLTISGRKQIILVGLHLRSKLMRNPETQRDEVSFISSYIKEIERKSRRTIVLGDFNANPFELGMISPRGFNATSSKFIAEAGPREFMKMEFDYFYSPLWSYMGDIHFENGNLKLPGTYFFQNSDDTTQTYWNIFDNMLFRKNIIKEIDLQSVQILESSNTHAFVNVVNGQYIIDRTKYSDHLPVVFKII